MVRLYHECLKVLQAVVTGTPERVPNQNDAIREKYKKFVKDLENRDDLFSVEVHIGDTFSKQKFLIDNDDHLNSMKQLFSMQQKNLEIDISAFCPTFLPKVRECHGHSTKFPGTRSNAGISGKLYTSKGIFDCKLYIAHCQVRTCKKKFFPFYEEDEEEGVITRKFYKPENYFGVTRETVFDTKLLEHFTSITMHGVVEFRNLEYIYNETLSKNESGEGSSLTYRIIDQNYFAYQIAQKLPNLPLVVQRDNTRNIDIEYLCSQAYPVMKTICSDNYLKHECLSDLGCKEKVAVIDGNAKNRRKICAAPKERVSNNIGKANYYKVIITIIYFDCFSNLFLFQLCVANPAKFESKYCDIHKYLENKSAKKDITKPTTIQNDLRPVTRAFAKKLVDQNVVDTPLEQNRFIGCRKDENVTKVYDTTWGIINIVRPCSIALGLYECYTAESLSQLALCLIDKFGTDPKNEELKIIACDVACGLAPFIEERSGNNEVFRNYAEKLLFVLDKFHANVHKKPACGKGPEGKYHPDLEKFRSIRGSNLEACENSFRAINKHKSTTNFMTAARRLVFFLVFQDEVNFRFEKKLETKGQLTSAGYRFGWRNKDLDYSQLYSKLVLYKGNVKNHTMPTVLPLEEIEGADDETRKKFRILCG